MTEIHYKGEHVKVWELGGKWHFRRCGFDLESGILCTERVGQIVVEDTQSALVEVDERFSASTAFAGAW